MSYRASVIKSMQPFTIAITGGATGTATLGAAVVVLNTVLIWNGIDNAGISNTDGTVALAAMTLTNTTTVTGKTNTTTGG